ncbi:Protein of unknown function [Flavobacterium indicum GPTSA100-9 = DSM 17447]|uniref:SnoaL-like domain-containing protein n=1 Tax=Flavobacterium indicum (strain DSM 17447 / CIP 109464 / GPTSA100-9) TaxID=1094466 RepID=H8XQR7_FLAIG|nr:hypothetical protein [Flavobacterium indicum]CCG53365.1 Protein of unknown function [Flavobacterium indicum GPTSA100-9 = DSM 17447]
MTNKEIILEIYQNDGLRNRDFLNEVLLPQFEMEWQSSSDLTILDKNQILNLADELKGNYATSNIDINYLIEEENKICIAYKHFATTIENTRDFQLIARFITIWEFENGKILKGYQISKPT